MNSHVLAVTGTIATTGPIPGADRIQRATVMCGSEGTWTGVVPKTMLLGDGVTVFLPDAMFPKDDARFEFMKRHKYIVKMSKFKGVPSECVILDLGDTDAPGTDVTARYGITKYEKTIEAPRGSYTIPNTTPFPSFLPKTDEPNVQRVLEWKALTRATPWYITEKADGSSCTAWKGEDGILHVASRNLELSETPGCMYWTTCATYDLQNTLPDNTAIQFEVCGPKVQGNPMGLPEYRGVDVLGDGCGARCAGLGADARAVTILVWIHRTRICPIKQSRDGRLKQNIVSCRCAWIRNT